MIRTSSLLKGGCGLQLHFMLLYKSTDLHGKLSLWGGENVTHLRLAVGRSIDPDRFIPNSIGRRPRSLTEVIVRGRKLRREERPYDKEKDEQFSPAGNVVASPHSSCRRFSRGTIEVQNKTRCQQENQGCHYRHRNVIQDTYSTYSRVTIRRLD